MKQVRHRVPDAPYESKNRHHVRTCNLMLPQERKLGNHRGCTRAQPLLIAAGAALGLCLAISLPSCVQEQECTPALPPPDAKFISLGQSYLPALGQAYAAAWDQGATCLEAGQSVPYALRQISQAWDAGRAQLFNRVVTPEFSKIVPEGQPPNGIQDAQRLALAKAWRGFAKGLRCPRK